MARTKVFRSGNSNAVRFPASFAVEPGMTVEVREEQNRWIVEKVSEAPKLIDLTGIWGSLPHLKPIASEDRAFDNRPSAIEGRDGNGG